MQPENLVSASRGVAATRSRPEKRALLAECLRAAAPDEIALVVNYLGGRLPQGRIGLGPAIVRALAGAAVHRRRRGHRAARRQAEMEADDLRS